MTPNLTLPDRELLRRKRASRSSLGAWLVGCLWLFGCGGRAEGGEAPSPSNGTGEPLRPVDCGGPVDQCSNRPGCVVVETYERLDESGCLERLGVPAGCILDDTVVRDEVTATFGPDGACWTFFDSGIPRAYRRSERCQTLIAQAPPCSDF